MKYLALIADPDEFEPLLAGLTDIEIKRGTFYYLPCADIVLQDKQVRILCTYIGKVNSASVCALALANDKYDGVFSIGYSGAVSGLNRFDIVAGSSCAECDFDLSPIGYEPGQKRKDEKYVFEADEKLLNVARSGIEDIKTGRLGTGDFFLTDKVKRDFYKDTFGICAFDMESAAAASVCYFLNVPFLAVRKISDDADDTASSAYRESLNKTDKAFSNILTSLVKSI